MSRTAVYHTDVHGRGALGPPPNGQWPGNGVLGAAGRSRTCRGFHPRRCFCGRRQYLHHDDVHLGRERFRLELSAYECRAEGTKLIELDRTEIFTTLRLKPVIRIDLTGEA